MLWKVWRKPASRSGGNADPWYIDIQDKVFAAMKEAEEDGTLGRGGALKRLGLQPGGAVVFDPADREIADRQAAARSMSTDDYVRMLVHYALRSREP